MAIKQKIKMPDFEADQQDAMKKTTNIHSLADQVEKLESLNKKLQNQEESMKSTKAEIQKVSGDIIPTMMSEMGLAELKSVSFGSGEDNKAADYAELAKSNGFQPTQKMKVEPMTLKALVRERIEAGKEMPTEIFGIYSENKTTIKRNK
jgi:hypothetical protein